MEPKKNENISIAVLGHIDSGKPTITGHLMHLTGAIDNASLEELSKQSE